MNQLFADMFVSRLSINEFKRLSDERLEEIPEMKFSKTSKQRSKRLRINPQIILQEKKLSF
jgi:hypothetical protein